MQLEEMERMARDIHAAACHPAMADILYRESIAANWNPKLQCFDTVTIRALKHNRTIPTQSLKVTVRFRAGDATDQTSVHRLVARCIADAGRAKKVYRLAKRD